MNYPGTSWYKSDLHVHTPASNCFTDKSITPEQWVQTCIIKGLGCVAITDHNTGAWIDKVKQAAEGSELIIFPGVELTCSDAKVHLLIIFDREATSQTVEDFVITCKIERENFSKQDAHSTLSVGEILVNAEKVGAIVIPAHIDEFNGLKNVAPAIQGQLFSSESILGVQVVHKEFILDDQTYQSLDKDKLLAQQKEYYKCDLSLGEIKESRNCVSFAIAKGKAILTFSDNPHQKNDSKHGLWGIGNRFTWLKMDSKPSLESLRHAFLLPDLRVCNDFENKTPQFTPDLWIKEIIVTHTQITEDNTPFCIKFSPQMTSLIGGRGSGKSSIIRFLIGAFNKQNELAELEQLDRDFKNFFKEHDTREKNGVLNAASRIEVYLIRNGDSYKLTYDQSSNPRIKLEKYNGSIFEEVTDERPEVLFDVEIFSQKQIFEIANQPNALRVLLDDNARSVKQIKYEMEELEQLFHTKKANIRSVKMQLGRKSELITKKKDLEKKFEIIKTTGLNEIATNQEKYQRDQENINMMHAAIKDHSRPFENIFASLEEIPQDGLNSQADHSSEINDLLSSKACELRNLVSDAKQLSLRFTKLDEAFTKEVADSAWSRERNKFKEDLVNATAMLKAQGIDQDKPDELLEDIQKTTIELKELTKSETLLSSLQNQLDDIRKRYHQKREQLTDERNKYLQSLTSNANNTVHVKVRGYQDRNDFRIKLLKILSANEGTFASEINLFCEGLPQDHRQSKIVDYIDHIVNDLNQLVGGGYTGNKLSGHFKNKAEQMCPEDWDKLELLLPEDDILIEYKASNGRFIPITSGSAGQKTAAVLTLILTSRTNPLILDQPEDDLDNSLIYDLIVEQLRKSKKYRQIIVVTHNANIPVNGDSELVVIMDSQSNRIKVEEAGAIENQLIKERICTIMEGGPEAFEMRAKRYNLKKEMIASG